MYKKLLSFILILCICMSINTNVYAHETIMYEKEASAVYDSEEASAVYDSEEASAVHDSEEASAVHDSEKASAVHDSEEASAVYDSEEASTVHDSEEVSAVYDSEEVSAVYDSEEVSAVYDRQDTSVVEDTSLIPQNGSKVNMESQQMLYSLRDNDGRDIQERYNVLVLDTSPATQFTSNGFTFYTADTALPYVKKASKKFIEDISKASGNNYIAIVTYGGRSASVISDFSTDTVFLKKK